MTGAVDEDATSLTTVDQGGLRRRAIRRMSTQERLRRDFATNRTDFTTLRFRTEPRDLPRTLSLSSIRLTVPAWEFENDWVPDALKSIHKLRSIPFDWDGRGAFPPNEIAVIQAVRVIQHLDSLDMKPLHIDPSTDNGICISFRKADRYADIECFSSGELFTATCVDGGRSSVSEVSGQNLTSVLIGLYKFLSR